MVQNSLGSSHRKINKLVFHTTLDCEHSGFPALFILMSTVFLGSSLAESFLFHSSIAVGYLEQRTSEMEFLKSKRFLRGKTWKHNPGCCMDASNLFAF